MKLLAKTLLSWQEPVLFAARIRDRRGWIWRAAIAGGIAAVMLLAFHADRVRGGRGPKFGTVQSVLFAAFIGVFLTSMLDATELNSQATISDDSVNVFGNAGVHMRMRTHALRDIQKARVHPPGESGYSFGILELFLRKGVDLIGIPKSLAPERVAEALHRAGIAVELPGWVPGPEPEQATAVRKPLEPVIAEATAFARIERLPEGETGQIVSPANNAIALTMALAPLLLSAMVFLGGAGIVLYRLAIQRRPASLDDAGLAVAAIGSLVGGLWFTSRFANLLPSLFIRRAARSAIELRPEALFNARDPEAIYVDVIPRERWGKVQLKDFSDCGLLKVDPLSRCVFFEGDLERWRIPAESLISVEVESYRAAGHVEGQGEGEWFATTVIRARTPEGEWEAPVAKCHVEFRPKNNALREANAVGLRDAIRALRPAAFA